MFCIVVLLAARYKVQGTRCKSLCLFFLVPCLLNLVPMAMAHSLSYCGDFVRQSDPDRFLLSMFAPADRREALWALFAFQGEIAKTRDVVSDSTLGRMRLQWWRDELEKIYAGHEAPAHEVLAPLAAAIRVHDLPLADFEMLLEAREFDLGDELPGNVEGFLNYADLTTTPLMRMAVQIEGCDPALEPVQAVAMNYALAGLLRVIPHWAGHGRCVLPEDVMAANRSKRRQMSTFGIRLHCLVESVFK